MSFLRLVADGEFEQIAALGLLARASIALSTDIFTATLQDIEAAFWQVKDN